MPYKSKRKLSKRSKSKKNTRSKKKLSHTNALKSDVSVYCMTCRAKSKMHKNNRNINKTKRGTHMLKGKCIKCNGTVVRII